MIIYSPIEGSVVDIDKVSDPVFSQKMMGDGIAIHPTASRVVAPISGTLTTVFPTKHAYGITGENGEEILIHIGINTVELNGQFFDLKVKQGQKVTMGDLLVEVDFDGVKQAGYDIVTPVIILNGIDFKEMIPLVKSGVLIHRETPLLDLVK